MLPIASAVTPSAALVPVIFSAGSGMSPVTTLVFALPPLVEECSILVEDLDSIVVAVADEQAAVGIHGEGARDVDLAGSRPFLAPGLDELSVLRKLHDARIRVPAMSVPDEDVTVGGDQDRGRRIELVGTAAGHAGLAERQQQPAIGTKLEDLVALSRLAQAGR